MQIGLNTCEWGAEVANWARVPHLIVYCDDLRGRSGSSTPRRLSALVLVRGCERYTRAANSDDKRPVRARGLLDWESLLMMSFLH